MAKLDGPHDFGMRDMTRVWMQTAPRWLRRKTFNR